MTGFGNANPTEPRLQIVLPFGCTHVDGVLHFAPGGVNSAAVNDGDFLHAPDGERLRVKNVEWRRSAGELLRTGTLVVERANGDRPAGTHGPGSLFEVEHAEREPIETVQADEDAEALLAGLIEDAAEEQTSDDGFQVPSELWDKVWAIVKHHPPQPDQIPRFGRLRKAAALFASVILAECPPCPDRQEAFNLVRRALMQANAAVALRGLHLDVTRSTDDQ